MEAKITNKVTMTFDAYDKEIEKMKNIETPTYWPTVAQIDMFEKDVEKWIIFCSYLMEYNDAPKNNEEKYSKKNLSVFVNQHLELVDDEDAE